MERNERRSELFPIIYDHLFPIYEQFCSGNLLKKFYERVRRRLERFQIACENIFWCFERISRCYERWVKMDSIYGHFN